MKKLLVLGLMFSLFTFGGSKEEVKTTYAAEPGTTAELSGGSLANKLKDNHADQIVRIKVSNNENDLPGEGVNKAVVSVGTNISAYVFKSADYSDSNPRYDCILYSTAETIFANKNSSSLFEELTALETINLSILNTQNVTNTSRMFYDCYNLTSVDLSNFDTSKVTNMNNMFSVVCNYKTTIFSKLQNITFGSNFNTSEVTDMSNMFSNCFNLTSLDISMFDTSKVTNMSGMFSSYAYASKINSQLQSIILGEKFNTQKVTDMSYMFSGCKSLKTVENFLNHPYFDTANVTTMADMFSHCSSLTTIDISKLNTTDVANMGSMFLNCSSLTELDFSKCENFKTSKVTKMGFMFSGCSSLTTLNISNFDTSNVTDMHCMFQACSSLTELDLSNFNTIKVKDVGSMFRSCSSLEKVNLSSFDLSNCTEFVSILAGEKWHMFDGCYRLASIASPKALPADSVKNSDHAIKLPEQFVNYCGVSELTTDNIVENNVLDITSGKFISEWRALRDANNSICNALVPGSSANAKLKELLAQYKTLDDNEKEKVDSAIDYEDVTIAQTMKYLQDVMNGTQSTEKDYGYAKNDSGSFMTLSIKEESPYLVAVISLIGVLSVAGYYFYNKKKQAN